ncbi:putative vacuolar assembly [Phaeomoniella chlamydospora]|uniref:Putative vacuolar assembly n=1 Tax=Phaeomoniella chlamydospora TaxID=158046 RepID=A0A0G2GER2_PHACM|nr:putative vacuolar assembly [Phaeomoniella chlamydospora]
MFVQFSIALLKVVKKRVIAVKDSTSMTYTDKSSNEQEDDEKINHEQQNGTKLEDKDSPSTSDNEEEEQEEEPRLKYAPLTKSLTSVYRNGDASSSFIVGGDKMVIGTHNGNIVRLFKALPTSPSAHGRTPSTSSESPSSKSGPKASNITPTLNNQIYIATSSIDGNVCIQNLIESRDVQLRNFGRPIQAVALSPEYKHDRIYLSGGVAGSLVLTVGGQIGKSTSATTTGAAAAASGWLGSIGLGANTGTDKILHSGEGPISTIKWSASGKYVLWVNEYGIKIMRSHLHLEGSDSGSEWKRIGHIDRPNRPGWDVMAPAWRARAEWIDRNNLDTEDNSSLDISKLHGSNGRAEDLLRDVTKRNSPDEVVVGWGGTVWMLKVFPGGPGVGKDAGEKSVGRVEIATILRTDCIISGVSLYTPNLLLVLAYIEAEEDTSSPNDTPTKRGRYHRQNALEPELRLIDISTKPEEEVSADPLVISRFETLSNSDYHLGILPPSKMPAAALQRGTLETIGSGFWNAAMDPTRMFSSSGSVRSNRSGDDQASIAKASSGKISGSTIGVPIRNKEVQEVAMTQGMKIFILSPYDCVVAVKRDLSDRVVWLTKTEKYQEAWELLDQHPEAAGAISEDSGSTSPDTPSKAGSVFSASHNASTSLAEFFADNMSTASLQRTKNVNSVAEKEKRRIGELWLQQLVSAKDWIKAGEIAGKVLSTSARWEHWAWIFIRQNKFDELAPFIPTFQLTPPLPSTIFEIFLGHYISLDRARFRELLNLWPTDLFEIASVATAVEDQLTSDSLKKDSGDWRILKECLARLFIADGRHEDALRCYIQLQNADAALSMIKEYHLLNAISDDILGLVMLRVSDNQLKEGLVQELESASSESIKLLVNAAYSGSVAPEVVVTQLRQAEKPLFTYFYLRALWRGESDRTDAAPTSRFGRGRFAQAALTIDEGKILVDEFADTAVQIFADFDRDLLMEYLQSSTAYTFDSAVKICEHKHYTSELVYLLSKTGQMKKALFLIINDLKDVSQAISFAKEQDDPDLWEDLLEYSMSKPKFIEGLLSEVGTAIDPIILIKRIPSGLEIEGLRDGLQKMIREYDLQDSISAGAARVLQSEVAAGMETLRKGRNKGLRLDIEERPISNTSADTLKPNIPITSGNNDPSNGETIQPTKFIPDSGPEPGHCAGCGQAFTSNESDRLIIFACTHTWHLSHLLNPDISSPSPADQDLDPSLHPLSAPGTTGPGPSSISTYHSNTVGNKVTTARLLRDRIAAVGGCRICSGKGVRER